MAPAMLTLEEAAAKLGVDRVSVFRYRQRGAFPNARQDERGRWLVPAAELKAFARDPRARLRELALKDFATTKRRAILERIEAKLDALAEAVARIESAIAGPVRPAPQAPVPAARGGPALLAAWRAREGLSLKAAGERVGCSDAYIALLERGKRTPTAGMVARVEKATGSAVPAPAWAKERKERKK